MSEGSKWFACCSLILSLGCIGAPAVAGAGAFLVTQAGCGVVIGSDGAIYTSGYAGGGSCNPAQNPWALVGNVASWASGEVIGINSKLEVLTAGGDEYQLALGGGCMVGARLVGNVFAITGVPLDNDPFVAFGDSNGQHVYAVTGQGRVFRRNVTGCSPTTWEYAGALPAGPTAMHRTSWGAVKIQYH